MLYSQHQTDDSETTSTLIPTYPQVTVEQGQAKPTLPKRVIREDSTNSNIKYHMYPIKVIINEVVIMMKPIRLDIITVEVKVDLIKYHHALTVILLLS